MQGVKQVQVELKLRESNLYANGRLLSFDDGTVELERDFPVYAGSPGDEYYTVRNNDTLDKIAWEKYKDLVMIPEDYWFVIADANDIENPLDLSEYVGQEILIPDVLNFRLMYGK